MEESAESITILSPIDDDETIARLTGMTDDFNSASDFSDITTDVEQIDESEVLEELDAADAVVLDDQPFTFATQFTEPSVSDLESEKEQDPEQVIIEDEEGLFSIGNITSIGNNEFNADFQKLVNSVLNK